MCAESGAARNVNLRRGVLQIAAAVWSENIDPVRPTTEIDRERIDGQQRTVFKNLGLQTGNLAEARDRKVVSFPPWLMSGEIGPSS